VSENSSAKSILDLIDTPSWVGSPAFSLLLLIGSVIFGQGFFSIFDIGFIFTVSVQELIIFFALTCLSVLLVSSIGYAVIYFYTYVVEIDIWSPLHRVRRYWGALVLSAFVIVLVVYWITYYQRDTAWKLIIHSGLTVIFGLSLLLPLVFWTYFKSQGKNLDLNIAETDPDVRAENEQMVTFLYATRYVWIVLLSFAIMFNFGVFTAGMTIFGDSTVSEIKFVDNSSVQGNIFHYSSKGILLIIGPGKVIFCPFDSMRSAGPTGAERRFFQKT
jgi:hypothetical protein